MNFQDTNAVSSSGGTSRERSSESILSRIRRRVEPSWALVEPSPALVEPSPALVEPSPALVEPS